MPLRGRALRACVFACWQQARRTARRPAQAGDDPFCNRSVAVKRSGRASAVNPEAVVRAALRRRRPMPQTRHPIHARSLAGSGLIAILLRHHRETRLCDGRSCSTQSRGLPSEMLVKEMGNLLERLFGLGRAWIAVVLSMRLGFEDLQHSLNSGLAQFAMHAYRVA